MATRIPEPLSTMTVEQLREVKKQLRGRADEDAAAPPIAQLAGGPRPPELPLSLAQEGLWFLAQLGLTGSAYNLWFVLRIGGALDVGALERALLEVVRRHETLRTQFRMIGGRGTQVVGPAEAFTVEHVDLAALDEGERAARLQELIEERSERVLDLEREALFRATLARTAGDEHVLIIVMHHIISDSWSNGILKRELSELYAAYSRSEPSPLPELTVQYADYALWQRSWLSGDVLERQLAYWRRQLADLPDALSVQPDRPRLLKPSFRGDFLQFALPKPTVAVLRSLARAEKTTLFTVLLAAFQTLLSRTSGETDVVVGSPKSGRTHRQTESLIGFFLNTLALRGDLSGSPSFRTFLRRVHATVIAAYERQDVPFDQLVADLQPARVVGRQPLFQVSFTLEAADADGFALRGLTVTEVPTEIRASKFDLSLYLAESTDGIVGGFEYATDLFDRSTIERLVNQFSTVLQAVVADPDACLSDVPLLESAERQQLLVAWNDTARAYPDRCLHELFAEQVRRTPYAIAVAYDDEQVSYAELDARANRLARCLRDLGVGPEVTVGVCLERSVELVVALLAILKAGGAYVPLDPGYPADRLAYMIGDARVAALVTTRALLGRVGAPQVAAVLLDEQRDVLERCSAQPLPSAVRPENLAYVIYTSGSTGRPKGVMNAHRGIVNRLAWMQEAYALDANDRVLQKTPLSFDVSGWEVFWPLLQGARVVLARPGGHLDAGYLVRTVTANSITRMHFVPSMLPAFLQQPNVERCSSLKDVFCSGETLSPELQQRFYETLGARLHNLYGPTEAAIEVSSWECERGSAAQTVPIGRPVANTQLYVLDARLEPVPVGVPGELCIGGVQVARGYMGAPALTAQRFVPDPHGPPGARLYRTGDRARYRADGVLEYLGRADEQVKIRGYRIELGEVEACLCEVDSIDQAVVLATGSGAERRLIAWVVPRGGMVPSASAVQAHLASRLPQFMIPSAVVPLSALPLTSNGKLDRAALLATDVARGRLVVEYIAPRDPIESRLASVWSDLLNVERVGALDDFFQSGGHSLLAMQAVVRVREAFGVELSLVDFFAAPTVEQLAMRLRTARDARPPIAIERTSGPRSGVTSFAQQRLWFLEQYQPEAIAYNVPVSWKLRGPLDVGALERSINAVVRRHEALRTVFAAGEQAPVQIVLAEQHVPLPVLDVSTAPDAAARASRALHEEAEHPFDLASGPLVRARLIRLGAEEHILALTVHHIVADGWSLGILVNELRAFYGEFTCCGEVVLPELAVQYADFAAWQREWLQGPVIEQQLTYWLSALSCAPASLSLATVRARPAVQTHLGAVLNFELDPALVASLIALGREHGATLFMTLAAALSVLLHRCSGQDDMCLGYPVANRTRTEIESLIGFFVNTLVLRSRVAPSTTFSALLRDVRESVLQGAAHQDLPFEKLVEELRPARNLSQSPLFQAMLSFDTTEWSLDLPGLRFEPTDRHYDIAKFDLTLFVVDRRGELQCSFEYATDLFDRSTVERLVSQFRTVLQAVVADPGVRVLDVPLLEPAERQRLLVEWNDTARSYPDRCLHELFAEQVRRTPNAVALRYERDALSYAELDARANRLAHYLRGLGVGPESLVGLCMERTPELVVALLAILKAGGGYVPLDPAYPAERLGYLLSDSGARVLLTHRALVDRFPEHGAQTVCVEELAAQIAELPADAPAACVRGENVAYCIATSGSTGSPKGVAVPHASAVAFLDWSSRTFGGADACVLFSTSICFDPSLFELFSALLSGGSVVLVDHALALAEAPARGSVTLVNTVPSAMEALLEGGVDLSAVRVVTLAGEALPRRLAARLGQALPQASIWNLYGSSETTYASCARVMPEAEAVTIGRPIANVQMYVLDASLEPVPIGVTGQIHVAGAALAREYWRRPALTAERFVPDPFGAAGSRMYASGDLGRYRTDGTIELVGRADHQVKIRGYRVELGEVEAALQSAPGITTAAVIVRETDAGDRALAAFVTASGGPPDVAPVFEHLRRLLPDHMVPASIVALDALPLTPTGKIDRRALHGVRAEEGGDAFVPPRTPIERAVAEIWEEVLATGPVGALDNFFDLGGHSLSAIRVQARILEMLDVEVPLATLYEMPTLADLANQVIVQMLGDDQGSIEAALTALGGTT